MRNAFEQHAGEAFELSPLHAPGRVFLSQPSDVAEEQGQQQEAAEEEEEAPAPSGSGPGAEAQQQQQVQQQQQQQQQQRGGSEAGSSGSSEAEAGAGATAEADSGSSSGAGAPVLQPKRQWVYRQAGEEEEFHSRWAAGGWLLDNPVGVPTEREHSVTALGEPVFRVLLEKK